MPPDDGSGPTPPEEITAKLREELQDGPVRRVPDRLAEAHAAVVLVLRPGERETEALFIRRARVEGDPWAGHMALPGGRQSLTDASLRETAVRETREETGLLLGAEDLVGPVSQILPRATRLPSIAITAYAAAHDGRHEVRPNPEVEGWVWVPLSALRDPTNRSVLALEREGERREFPTVEYRGHTIWGLTHRIVQDVLSLLDREPPG